MGKLRFLQTLAMAVGLIVSAETGSTGLAQATSPDLPAGVQDVVKLVKAGVGEDVVLAHIKNSSATYNFSVDQIIYLHDQGVSQNELKALMSSGPTPNTPTAAAPVVTPNPVPAAPPPPQSTPTPVQTPSSPAAAPLVPPGGTVPEVPTAPIGAIPGPATLESFQAQLAPYGRWADVPTYGPCWRPNLEAANPYWRPYCDGGNWLYTDDGWTWQSDYPWGNIVFHYGRWYRDGFGWVWVPGYDWAPAWVCWRQADGYCGWAALPPAAVFRVGVGLWYGGRAAVDVDFGLGPDAFTFVAYDHFWDHNLHPFLLPRARLALVFGHSVVLNGYHLDHGRFIVEGLGRERMAALTHREIRVEARFGHEERFERHPGPEHGPDRGFGHDDRRDRRGR